MTIDEMFNEIENQTIDTYIVTLKYKYDFEENYTIENQILVYDSVVDEYAWQNDWNEGQTDVEVLGYMILGDVDTTKLLTCEDCVSRAYIESIVEELENICINRDEHILLLLSNIKNAPSVTPSRPRGKWIHWTDDYKDYVTCSCCEYGEEGEVLLSDKTPFCPICGADMRESEK